MYSEFIKEDSKIIEKSDIEKNEELISSIKMVRVTLENMYNNLQFADGDLVDYYTYRIKAEEAKYDYLIKQAKNKKLDIF